MAPFLALILASVLNAATSASLGNSTDLMLTTTAKPESSCDTICLLGGVDAPNGCSYEMETRGMSEELSKMMLDKHNELRRKLAKGEEESWPSAANMKKLTWSEELASSAQEQEEQCNGIYDLPRATFGRTWIPSDPGSNTTMTMGDFEKIVDYWYSSTVDSFGNWTDPPFGQNQPDITRSFVTKSGPFWGETKAMGCGLVIFSRENWRMLELSCYYESPTSVASPSDPLYEEGPPCSSCQQGFSCEDGLCASTNPEVSTTERGTTKGESTDVSGPTETESTSGWEN